MKMLAQITTVRMIGNMLGTVIVVRNNKTDQASTQFMKDIIVDTTSQLNGDTKRQQNGIFGRYINSYDSRRSDGFYDRKYVRCGFWNPKRFIKDINSENYTLRKQCLDHLN
jgi:hypothetical protein